MTITNAVIFHYRLPLKFPLVLTSGRFEYREGLLIKLTSDNGEIGWGEVAPLFGFSKESFADARTQLTDTSKLIIGHTLPEGTELLNSNFEDWLGEYTLAASVRCGIEMAVLNLIAAEREVSVATLLSKNSIDRINVNTMITGNQNQIAIQTQSALASGYNTIKLKVGLLDIEEDIARTHAVSDVLKGRAKLRLDANRAWSIDDALKFAAGIDGCKIEYIEEPVDNVSQIDEFTKRSGIPVALDETLLEINPVHLQTIGHISAIVIKPTLIGSIERSIRFVRAAHTSDIKTVFSSTFESSLGISFLVQLAAAFSDTGTAAGLDTLSWFKKDVTTTPVSVTDGNIHLDQLLTIADNIDFSMLNEIDNG